MEPQGTAHAAVQAQAGVDAVTDRFANRLGWGPRMLSRLVREPALAITVSYLFVGAVGLWSSYWYYRALGIPVLEYYQASDFLIAGLRDPYNFLALSIALALGLISYSSAWYALRHPERVAALRRRWWGWLWFNPLADPHRTRRWYDLPPELALTLAVLLGGGALMVEHARDRAHALRAGEGTPLRITLQGDRLPLQGQARLAGTSSSHLFLYWPANGRTEALPAEAVARIEHLPRRPLRPPAVAKR
jgi:hypothetical protein